MMSTTTAISADEVFDLWGTDQPVVSNFAHWTEKHAEALERIRELEATLAKERESRSVLVVRRTRFRNFSDDYLSIPVADLPSGVRLACERPLEKRRPRVPADSVAEMFHTVRFVPTKRYDIWSVYRNWIVDVDGFAEYLDLDKTLDEYRELTSRRFPFDRLSLGSVVDRLLVQYGHDEEWTTTFGAELSRYRDIDDALDRYARSSVDVWDEMRAALSTCFKKYEDEMKTFLTEIERIGRDRFNPRVPVHEKFLATFYV